jgi:hypothetical protein
MERRTATIPQDAPARNGGRTLAPPRPVAARLVGYLVAVQDGHATFLVRVGSPVGRACRCGDGGDCRHIAAALTLQETA